VDRGIYRYMITCIIYIIYVMTNGWVFICGFLFPGLVLKAMSIIMKAEQEFLEAVSFMAIIPMHSNALSFLIPVAVLDGRMTYERTLVQGSGV